MTDIARKSFTPAEYKLDEQGTIELAFAQLNVIDKDGDVTLPGAFGVKDVPMSAYGHTSWDGALPVGKGTISERGDWAVFKGQFFLDTTAGRDTYNTIKALGPLAEYSYGYTINEDGASRGKHDGQMVRFLKSLDTHEVSPVLRGAGVGTHTLAIKSGSASGSLADAVERYLDDSKALTETLRSMADVRAKEGRVLSEANRTRLVNLREALTAVGIDLDDLLAATSPAPKSFDVTAEVLAMEARRLGVRI